MPKIPWELVPEANGYRLPTFSQYVLAVHCNYTRGTPWKETKRLAEIGGDYTIPLAEDSMRPLFSLAPNRFGLFVNDRQRGIVTCGSDVIVAAHLGEALADRYVIRHLPLLMYSIHLAQAIPGETDIGDSTDVNDRSVKLENMREPSPGN